MLDPPILLALATLHALAAALCSPLAAVLAVVLCLYAPQILFDQQLSDTHTGKIVIKLQGYCIYYIIVLMIANIIYQSMNMFIFKGLSYILSSTITYSLSVKLHIHLPLY